MTKQRYVTIDCDGFGGQLYATVEAESAEDAEQIVYEMWRNNARDADAVCDDCGYRDCVCDELEDDEDD